MTIRDASSGKQNEIACNTSQSLRYSKVVLIGVFIDKKKLRYLWVNKVKILASSLIHTRF